MLFATALLLGLGCSPESQAPAEGIDAVDVTVNLADGQARAGVVGNETALWAGLSAEGQLGDIKIYNSRVRFIIQAARTGSYYLDQGGSVIDADLARPLNQPGRDLVDEWAGMAGLGRLVEPEQIRIVDNGATSNVAVVEVTGWDSPLHLMEGALEANGVLFPPSGLQITHTYTLPADSWMMQVDTTVTATTTTVTFAPGDAILGAHDASAWWGPERGYLGIDSTDRPWNGYLGDRNESAFGIFAAPGTLLNSSGLEALSGLLEIAAGFGETVTLEPGQSTSYTRYWGIAPDFASLTDAHLALGGTAVETLSGQVTDGTAPVAGARVVVLVDDAPYTLAVTDANGAWSADVPQGSATKTVVDGRGPGPQFDLPEGAAMYGPYTANLAQNAVLTSYQNGAKPIALAQGYGWSDTDTLVAPGTVTVEVADGLPFEVRMIPTSSSPAADARVVRPRVGGFPSSGWSTQGSLTLAVEPGTYQAVVHRGQRFERFITDIEVVSGETVPLNPTLPQAFEHPGWLFGDPHCHASPSPDGRLPMDHRAIQQAGVGVQLHFGTDHDHVADYTPMLEPLGIADVLNSVVATEMSPVVRGHKNLYPLSPRNNQPNGGGYPWWRTPVDTTAEEVANLRARHGGALTENSGFAIQINHPVGTGMMDFASWEPGNIGSPDFWSDDFNAMEVMNSSAYDEYFPIYVDLVNRGMTITPTGVTDSHDYFSGGAGLNGTWFAMGTDDPTDYTPDLLRETLTANRVVVSRGLFLELSVDPGSTVVGSTDVEVTAIGASWAQPNRLRLYENGVEVQVIESASGVFSLDAPTDAAYIIIAEGDESMAPVYNTTPWAMAAAILLDADGDGWTPPLPPYTLDAR